MIDIKNILFTSNIVLYFKYVILNIRINVSAYNFINR